MMFIYKTAKFTPVWTTILKVRAIFVLQTLTEHALLNKFLFLADLSHSDGTKECSGVDLLSSQF